MMFGHARYVQCSTYRHAIIGGIPTEGRVQVQ